MSAKTDTKSASFFNDPLRAKAEAVFYNTIAFFNILFHILNKINGLPVP
jgi:hypothetical protein